MKKEEKHTDLDGKGEAIKTIVEKIGYGITKDEASELIEITLKMWPKNNPPHITN